MSRRRTSTPAPPVRRCVIYTRKSTSMGLEQEFNTLDAQRDAWKRIVDFVHTSSATKIGVTI